MSFSSILRTRPQTYRKYAWPAFLAGAFERNGVWVSLVTAASIAGALLLSALLVEPTRLFAAHSDAQGSFYALIPHQAMAGAFAAVFAFVLFALGVGFVRFWLDTGEELADLAGRLSLREATWEALGLKYLEGGGEGCTYPTEKPSFARRNFHHFTFYGFPVVLCRHRGCHDLPLCLRLEGALPAVELSGAAWHRGRVGSAGWACGTAVAQIPKRSAALRRRAARHGCGIPRAPSPGKPQRAATLDLARAPAMGLMLAIHLGAVLALFLTLPYGKFVHALYRFAALLRFHIERRRPLPEIGAE